MAMVFCLIFHVMLFFEIKLVDDHGGSDGKETDKEGIGENLILIYCFPLTAVIDKFVMCFRYDDD